MEIQNFDKMTDQEIRDYIANESDPWKRTFARKVLKKRGMK